MTTDAAAAADIVYPETDGMPLPDGGISRAAVHQNSRDAADILQRRGGGASQRGYVHILRPGRPAALLLAGLLRGARTDGRGDRGDRAEQHLPAVEMGKPPDFILEIGSPSTADVDVGSKRELYAEIGVGEYWRYDGTGGDFYGEALVGERLADGEYERLEMRTEEDGSVWSHSAALNLDLWWVDGELSFWDPVGEQWLLSHEEEHDGRLEAQERVEVERGGG